MPWRGCEQQQQQQQCGAVWNPLCASLEQVPADLLGAHIHTAPTLKKTERLSCFDFSPLSLKLAFQTAAPDRQMRETAVGGGTEGAAFSDRSVKV